MMQLTKLITLILVAGGLLIFASPQSASAQCYGGVTAYYAPQPVVTYYAPPVTTYYAPAPVTTYYAPTPVTTYYAPVYYYRPGLLGRIFGW